MNLSEQFTEWLKDKFSFTKMTAFSKCPRFAFYKYIMRKKAPPSVALIYGRAAHMGQEEDNRAKVRGEKLRIDQVLDIAAETYKAEEGPDTDGFVKDHAAQLEKFETSGKRAQVCPKSGTIEAPFQIVFNVTHDPEEAEPTPVLVEGWTDVVSQDERTGKESVVDYKAVARAFTEADAQKDDQLTLNMVGAEAQAGRFVSFVKGGRQKPNCRVTRDEKLKPARLQHLLQFVADTVAGFRRCLKTGDWPKCSPKCFWCTERCEYWEYCYPKSDPHMKDYINIEQVAPAGKCSVDSSWRTASTPKAKEGQQ